MKPTKSYIVPAAILTALVVLLAIISLLMILSKSVMQTQRSNGSASAPMTAEIYQNGKLFQSIPLSSNTSQHFTITGEGGCYNEITITNGSIAITDANCPDKLCVHQGFISTSLLPITCLPNRVVIQVRELSVTADGTIPSDASSDEVDAITY